MEGRTEIGQLGEFGLIQRITADFNKYQPATLYGVGDDAAVIDCGDHCQLISTDMLLEGIHFDLMYSPLKHLGYKAVAVNLSDICAMNGIPKQITVNIGLSNRFSVEAVETFYEGVRAACDYYAVDLIGGDTCSSQQGLVLSVTAIGTAKKENICYRNTAKAGDILCVTGDLGASYLGLQILEREKQLYLSQPDVQPEFDGNDYLIMRQLKPEARLDMVRTFADAGFKPTAMIDVSDGVASEVFHICTQSGVGAYVEEAKMPMREDSELQAIKFQLDPVTCCLNGGEDYELLFTASPDDLDKIKILPDVSIIGEITAAEKGIKLFTSGGNIHDLKAQGWQHFDQ